MISSSVPAGRLLLLWPFLLLATLCLPQRLAAQTTGVISGRVIQEITESPIEGASVTVTGQTAQARTDADGRFVLRDVRVGIVQVEVRRIGFAAISRGDLAVSPGKPLDITLALRASETSGDPRLETVFVRPTAFPMRMPSSTPVSTQRYDAEEVRRQPGAQEDVLRAVSIAPGVGVTSAARNDLVVRGGAPFENLFVVDNLEVPNINHFGSQGSTGGPISLINVRFVENASLSAGGFGARYGDRTSSVTTLTLREGNRERLAGEVNVAATQVGAVLEGPLGERGSFLANIRQSYLDLLFKAIGLSFIPSYTDATFKGTWRPTSRDAVSLLTIAARGTVSFDNSTDSARVDNSQVLAPVQEQYFSGLTWKRLLPQAVVTTTLGRTYTGYRTTQRDSLLQPVFTSRSTEGETSLRTDVSYLLSPRLELEAGSVFKYASRLHYDVELAGFARRDAEGTPTPLRVDTTFTAWRNGSYLQAAWQTTPRLRLSAGLRGDWYGFLDNAYRVAPRLSATVELSPRTTFSLSGGRYWQAPSYIWLVGASENQSRLRPFAADQVVAGISRLLREDLKVQFEVYGKQYRDYPVRLFRPQAVLSPSGFDDVTSDIPFGLEPLGSSGTGTSTGAELFLQKKLGQSPWYGQLSASVNRTRFAGIDQRTRVGAFDTPVNVNGVLGWRPDARWEVAVRTRASSGLPFTPFLSAGADAGTLDFTRYNSERAAMFFATDLRVDRRWWVKNRQLIVFLDMQNITNRENQGTLQWNPRLRMAEPTTGVGLLPSIGINFEF